MQKEYDFYEELMKQLDKAAEENYAILDFRWDEDGVERSLKVRKSGAVLVDGKGTRNGNRIRDALISFALTAEREKHKYEVHKTKIDNLTDANDGKKRD